MTIALYVFAAIGAWFVITALVAGVFGIVRSVRSKKRAAETREFHNHLMKVSRPKFDGLD